MAKDGIGGILGIGIAAVAGYWLYQKFVAVPVVAAPAVVPTATGVQPAPAGAGSGSEPTGKGGGINPAAYPAWMANLAALGAQLQTMAGAPQQNIDQWSSYYNNLRQQRNMPTLTGAQVSAILAINPATAADRSASIGAPEYVNDIFNLGYGLQGLRRGMGAARPFNPIMLLPYRSGYGYMRSRRVQ